MAKRPGYWIALLTIFFAPFYVAPLEAQTQPPAAQQAQPSAAQQAQPGKLLNGAPEKPQQIAVQPPFELTPQEQTQLNQLLGEWEKNNSAIKTFRCSFTRREYDPTFINDPKQPKSVCLGEIKYAAPDKGLFHVTDATDFVLDPKTQAYNPVKVEPTEYWTCNGKSMFEVDAKKKQIIERPIPPELQGKSITEGPLPFVFGAKADSLKTRYFMRVITPKDNKDEVWLEARPKTQHDAANFSSVELILAKPDLQPVAIQIHNPGSDPHNPSRTVITLENPSVNSPWAPLQQLFNDFARPNILGYKHVLDQPQVPPPPTPQNSNQGSLEQAGRGKAPAR